MQFIFTFGAVPVVAGLMVCKCPKFEKDLKGIFFGTANGVFSAIGGIALFAALSPTHHWNTSVISAVTALYPLVTVLLAITVLRERLRSLQVVGLVFAAVAIIIFSV
jgi:transporter family protein